MLSQAPSAPLRSLLEQLKKLQAIVVQSTSKSAQTGTCIAVSASPSPVPRVKVTLSLGRGAPGGRGLWAEAWL